MEKLFMPYRFAKDFNKHGYNEPCFGIFINGVLNMRIQDQFTEVNKLGQDITGDEIILALLYTQATEWLRVKHNLDLIIHTSCSINEIYGYYWLIHKLFSIGEPYLMSETMPNTYNEVLQLGIKECLRIINTNLF